MPGRPRNKKEEARRKRSHWSPSKPVGRRKKRGNRAVIRPVKRKNPARDILKQKRPTAEQRLRFATQGKPLAKPGQARLTCAMPKMNIIAQLAPEPPIFTGGFEGWEIIPRPKSDSMTVWSGNTSLQMTFTIVLDGFKGRMNPGVSQESNIRDLIRVARGGTRDRPGIIAIQGIAGSIADTWVIENLEFGDQIRRATDGHRIRQFITIVARQYQPPEYRNVKRGALKQPKRKVVRYKIKKGDTPIKIAKHHNCSWVALKKLNPKYIKRARQKLQVGRKINVPGRINPKVKHKK